jgi:hypothetical protein
VLGAGEGWELVLSGQTFSFGGWKVLEMDGGDSHTAM